MAQHTEQEILDLISGLNTSKADCAAAIAAKGVTVPAGSLISDYSALIDGINAQEWVTPDKLFITCIRGSSVGTISVTASGSWNYQVGDSWCSVTRSGDTLTYSLEANPHLYPRQTDITITSGTAKNRVTICQLGQE